MRFTTLVATSFITLASTTSAFLIPPNYVLQPVQKTEPSSSSDRHILRPLQKSHPSPSSENEHRLARLFGLPSTWKVDLDCPGCDWAASSVKDVETVIEIEVDADEKNGLLLNHIAALQPDRSQNGLGKPQSVSLVARQRRLDTGERSVDQPLDFVLERLQPVKGRSHHGEQGVTITPVRFTVVGFAGKPVKVDTLAIDVIETGHGVQVARVKHVSFETTPGAQSCEGQAAWSYCRVKAIIQSRVLETIQTMREKGRQAKTWVGKGCGHGMRHSGSRHGPHRAKAHKWARMLHSTLRFLVIPALLGIVGGLLASAVGMLVGQIMVFVWARLGRDHCRRRRASCCRSVIEVIVTEDEKDRLLLENEEVLPSPPPRYEDLEAGVVYVVDEKS